MRLCKVRGEIGSAELEAAKGDPYIALDVEGDPVGDDGCQRTYLDPDGADELARHLAAWAARQRRGS